MHKRSPLRRRRRGKRRMPTNTLDPLRSTVRRRGSNVFVRALSLTRLLCGNGERLRIHQDTRALKAQAFNAVHAARLIYFYGLIEERALGSWGDDVAIVAVALVLGTITSTFLACTLRHLHIRNHDLVCLSERFFSGGLWESFPSRGLSRYGTFSFVSWLQATQRSETFFQHPT